MTFDTQLLTMMVCPLCKGALELTRHGDLNDDLASIELMCPADGLAFPIRDGLAIMLESQARALGGTTKTGQSVA
jgi:uncharacterized protein